MIKQSLTKVIVLVVLPTLATVTFYLSYNNIKTTCYIQTNLTCVQNVTICNDKEILTSKFDEIFRLSNESSIDEEILTKTLIYMIEERDQYDPELVDFVRSLIVSPDPTKPLNLWNTTVKDYSQVGQSTFVDGLLKSKRDGFFIEAGGFTGEGGSNSLFFELERNWAGLLVEPIPSFYKTILSKNRNIYVLNACLSKDKPVVAKFRIFGGYSGRISELSSYNRKNFDNLTKTKTYAYFPCFSLNTITRALNIDRIDYLSLDLEGAEPNLIKELDFQRLDITAISVENSELVRNETVDFLKSKGFNLTNSLDQLDLIFLNSK